MESSEGARYSIDRGRGPGDSPVLVLTGSWKTSSSTPDASVVQSDLLSQQLPAIRFDCEKLASWDTELLLFIATLKKGLDKAGVETIDAGLPAEVRALLHLAEVGGANSPVDHCPKRHSFIEELGEKSSTLGRKGFDLIAFIGEFSSALFRLLIGRSTMRFRNLLVIIQRVGPDAFPIVTLISVLVGVILALIGSGQLAQFGAQLYVANLVGVGMTREMGAVMVGVILAGRTGAAYAAELGSMQANEEIDALKTLGISPIDFLVLPRILALMVMAPLLCVYADVLGILGGAFVTFSSLELSPRTYWEQTLVALQLSDFLLGIVKSFAFGLLVAVSGCLCGMYSGRNASAVGDATTSAVVTGIVLIVVADAMFSIVASILNV